MAVARERSRNLPAWLRRQEPGPADPRGRFLIGAAIGTGMIAKAAERGGADLLLALNAGRLRVMGAPSIACMLPVHEANRFVADFARAEILGKVSVPVVFGVSAFDPRIDIGELLARIRDWGFAGIVNFPTSIHVDDHLQAAMARNGLGYAREVELIRRAGALGLGTVAYARKAEQAVAMVEAGADMLCLNHGWNAGGISGLPSPLTVEEAGRETARIFRRLRHLRPDLVCVVEGGPIETPENVAAVCDEAEADGYIGGSTIDRLPLENAVSEATSALKSVASLSRRLEDIQDEILGGGRRFGLIGRSPAMQEVVRLIDRFAATDLGMLVLGANGTGKELVAQALHAASPRSERAFVAVNCAAIPRELIEGEFFGFEKGAFTGADRVRVGRFEEAHGGTLFLDEIGDLEQGLQAKLLRVIETGTLVRLGASQQRRVNVRVICATNRNLRRMVAEGRFREDLYYRLNKMEIVLPTLAERIEDLPLLVEHLLQTAVRAIKPAVRSIDGPALRTLMGHTWPGNVRELKNALERAAILCDGDRIGREHLPRFEEPVITRPGPDATIHATLPNARPADPWSAGSEPGAARRIEVDGERAWILDALMRHRFRRGATAAFLGLSRKTLYNKMRHHGLDA